jgi:hypothetical protein
MKSAVVSECGPGGTIWACCTWEKLEQHAKLRNSWNEVLMPAQTITDRRDPRQPFCNPRSSFLALLCSLSRITARSQEDSTSSASVEDASVGKTATRRLHSGNTDRIRQRVGWTRRGKGHPPPPRPLAVFSSLPASFPPSLRHHRCMLLEEEEGEEEEG